MKILLLGKDGQVGWELQRALAPIGDLAAVGREEADLANPAQLRALIAATQPAVIVNAAAYTAVDQAESEPGLAMAINGIAPGILAEEAGRLGAWLVHYSTDYVFDGSKETPYREDDATNPLSVYGATKLAGEQAIVRSGCRHLVFRTSWVCAARGGNFAKTMLRLAKQRASLNVVADQFGAPTAAELIADVTAHCLRDVHRPGGERLQGRYHLVAGGETNWHTYARFVLAEAAAAGVALQCMPENVAPIPASAYPTPAKRPANSRLDTMKLQQSFGIVLPDWTFHVRRMLAEVLGSGEQ